MHTGILQVKDTAGRLTVLDPGASLTGTPRPWDPYYPEPRGSATEGFVMGPDAKDVESIGMKSVSALLASREVRIAPREVRNSLNQLRTLSLVTLHKEDAMKGINPCLWFDGQAEEAARFYTSIFKNSKIGSVSRYGEAGAAASGRPKGSVMTVTFQIDGQKFVALNGGPHFKFTEAISFMVNCETQQEIDHFWEKLSEGGEPGPCGWLKDKYGLSWQIVPAVLEEMMQDKDARRSERVMEAILKMKKLDIKALKEAHAHGEKAGVR